MIWQLKTAKHQPGAFAALVFLNGVAAQRSTTTSCSNQHTTSQEQCPKRSPIVTSHTDGRAVRKSAHLKLLISSGWYIPITGRVLMLMLGPLVGLSWSLGSRGLRGLLWSLKPRGKMPVKTALSTSSTATALFSCKRQQVGKRDKQEGGQHQ